MYTVYTQLPPERNSIYQNHLIKLLLWKLWLCWDDPKQKPFFNAVSPLSKPQCNPLTLKKNGVEPQNVQKEKGKEKCGSPSPVKILYRLDPYENVSSKYHLTDVFPRLYIGTDTEPTSFQTASFMVEEGPRRHNPANYFQHSDLHLPETLHTRTEDGWPTFTLTNTSPLLGWICPVCIPSGSCKLVNLLSFYFLHSPTAPNIWDQCTVFQEEKN